MNPFHNLNPPQREAVNTLNGPLLVLAGAGSGKTRVVTFRIANLLQQGVMPHAILGLTFTNKAAKEMKERVQALTQSNVLICTFHSLGARILRESIDRLGYKRDFTIYDEEDIDKVLKHCLADLDIEKECEPKDFRYLISQAKNSLIDSDQAHGKDNSYFPKVYALYEAKLKEYNALDFDDLLFLTIRLLKEHPDILHAYRERWKYLLIDEYQDTNQAQYELIQLLAGDTLNVCAVGDPDQSIYSWRGANINNILSFEKDFPGAKVIRLEQNYRSTGNILEAANAVIRHNDSRLEKTLWSDLGPGERIKWFTADNERGEALFIADRIRYHHEQHGIPLNQMVVFYRTNGQSRVFEDVFLQKRIPYSIVGSVSFYQRREVKDILAFLRVVHSGGDLVSFIRTINLPKRGFGDVAIQRLRQGAGLAGLTILAYCETILAGDSSGHTLKLSAKQKEGLQEYVHIIRELKKIQEVCSLKVLVTSTIEASGYLKVLDEDKETYNDRKGNLDSLIAKAIEWEACRDNPNLSDFLEELSLRSSLDDSNPDKEHANLMTIHNGKGLEFSLAFLVGVEQDLFPHANSRKSDEGLEEERRLFYVGMTRAKQFLYITHALNRFIWGTSRMQHPSIFLREIPFEYMEKMRLPAGYAKPTYERSARITKVSTEEDTPVSSMEIGDSVFHKEFGVGVIKGLTEGTLGLTYKILFSKDNRERSLAAKLAPLIKL